MEAMNIAEDFKIEVENYEMSLEDARTGRGQLSEKPKPSFFLMGRTIYEHVLDALKDIKSAELESALRFLNFRYSIRLLFYLEHAIRKNVELELASRSAIYIVKRF